MKKLLTAFAMLMIGMSTTFVQAQTKTQKVETTQKTMTKSDGTPDMRYKHNKTTTTKTAKSSTQVDAPVQSTKESKTTITNPTKKDGTPDMRYKTNKSTTVKKVTRKN
ncbi:hypothetical protein [Mucilaginibacter sp. CSA2-8R]|uniref:hypothetical protein n=1 Tax=Mucilaginibacter sp. CSA2-8R TaxID=3141542 RepID=UPI00315D838B